MIRPHPSSPPFPYTPLSRSTVSPPPCDPPPHPASAPLPRSVAPASPAPPNLKKSLRLTAPRVLRDRKSTRLNSSHANISYAVFCLKKKKSTKQHLYYTYDRS